MSISLNPKSKTDVDTAKRAIKAGYPAVQPVLGELVQWLQDYNWPVAKVLAPFLAEIGMPLVPHIDHVLETNDESWKYWMIVCLISQNEDLFECYRETLIQYSEKPSANDQHHELDQVAREALVKRGHFS